MLVGACVVGVGLAFGNVGGFVLGTLLGLGLVAVWGVTPWGRRRHWRAAIFGRDHPELEGPLAEGVHSAFVLVSKHPHFVRRPRCVVTDPDGREYRTITTGEDADSEIPFEGVTPGGIGPGGIANYPTDFDDAPAPRPGRYTVRWEFNVENRRAPVVVARQRWKVA